MTRRRTCSRVQQESVPLTYQKLYNIKSIPRTRTGATSDTYVGVIN